MLNALCCTVSLSPTVGSFGMQHSHFIELSLGLASSYWLILLPLVSPLNTLAIP